MKALPSQKREISDSRDSKRGQLHPKSRSFSAGSSVNLLLTLGPVSYVAWNEKAWRHSIDRSSSCGSRSDDGDLDHRLAERHSSPERISCAPRGSSWFHRRGSDRPAIYRSHHLAVPSNLWIQPGGGDRQLEEADAILTCQTESTIVPAKVIVRRTIAEVTLVDRRSQKPIWRTTKSALFDRTMLADDIMAQLKQDWRKSANEY
jgi:hypothetical protein